MGEISNAMVCLLGMGNVFVGLIVIVLLCKIMSIFVQWMERSGTAPAASDISALPVNMPQPQQQPPNGQQAEMEEVAISAAFAEMLHTDISNIHITSIKTGSAAAAIPNRQEIIAATSAAIAEMSGTDISAIRVVSFRQL
ncbi:MAG: OadG family protein [Lachnospiraceae bacterium]